MFYFIFIHTNHILSYTQHISSFRREDEKKRKHSHTSAAQNNKIYLGHCELLIFILCYMQTLKQRILFLCDDNICVSWHMPPTHRHTFIHSLNRGNSVRLCEHMNTQINPCKLDHIKSEYISAS